MRSGSQAESIVRAAHAKFLRYGIRRVSMEEIARDLRMSKKTLYTHFASKEELVRACTLHIASQLVPRVEEAVLSEGSASEKLIGVWKALAALPRLVSGELVGDIKVEYPHLWQEIDARRRAAFEHFEEMIRAGVESGDIRREINPKVMMRVLRAILEHVMIPEVLMLGEFTPADAVQTLVTAFAKGMLADGSSIDLGEGPDR